MIHSDQGPHQFTGKEWQSFLSKHNLDASRSRRGNWHDNAVAESFFPLLKLERIRRRTYLTRDAAMQDVFDLCRLIQGFVSYMARLRKLRLPRVQ
jgi:putative transposase